MEKLLVWLEKAVVWIYGILMVIIGILCIVGNTMNYYTKKNLPYHNFIYLLAGSIGIVILYAIAKRCERLALFQKYNKTIMLTLTAILGIGLIAAAYHYYFRTGWDAGVVISEASKIAHCDYDNLWNWYFSRCSNNTFITVIFSCVIRAGSVLGFGNDYFYLVAFQCIGWAYVGYIVWLIADKVCRTKAGALLAWFLYVILVGMSPWVVVPYTDTVGMLWFATVVYLLLDKRHVFILGILLASGYFVKPQILIIGIAAVILCAPDYLKEWRQHSKAFGRKIIWMFMGVIMGLVIVIVGRVLSHIQVEEQKSLGIPHYLMLGLNARTNGVFAEEDLIFSESFGTKEERNAADLEKAVERLKDMGVTGLMTHLGKKLLTVYNDGTFAWGTEGGFFEEMFYSGHSQIRAFFREIYIPDGKNYSAYLNVMQAIWMGILCFAAFVFASSRQEKSMKMLALAIIGFTIFELLMEPRARHVLIYLSIWIPFACIGLENITQWIDKKRKNTR